MHRGERLHPGYHASTRRRQSGCRLRTRVRHSLWGYLTMVTFSKKGEPKKGGDDLPSIVRGPIEEASDIRDLGATPTRSAGRTASGAAKEAGGRAAREIPVERLVASAGQGGPSPVNPGHAGPNSPIPASAGPNSGSGFVGPGSTGASPPGASAPGSSPLGSSPLDISQLGPDPLGLGQDDPGIVRAASDDREAAGQIMQSLRRRPARTPYIIALLFTALWSIAVAALIYGFSGHLRQISSESGLAPTVIGLCGAFGAPIVFFFALASMIARLSELRIVSSMMAEATLRFAQPETAAHDSIMSIGQAIRREVAAMGDGVERTLARAVELESLVNNEVAVLERSYSENEVRIRNLLAGLAQQREILVGQAEQVRNAITHVHLDLSHDITTVSELIAERVNEAAQRVTQSLADKGEQITVALGAAGDTMIEHLGERGGNLLKQIESSSESATGAIDAAGDRMTSGLNFKSEQITDQVISIAASLQQSLSARLDEVVVGFSQKSASALEAVENRTRELAATISDRSETVSQALTETTGRIAETIASRANEANNSLKTTGESIVLDLSLRGGDMVTKLEGIGQKITESIVSRSDFMTQ